MSNSNTIVSIIVLTYNQEQTIARTLDSIISQKTEYSFEIILGEDASPSDNTRVICESYATKFPNIIKLMPKSPNKGLLRNVFDCLAVAQGTYIACCSGDDWWHNPDKLQIQVDFMEQHPEFGLVHSDINMFYVENKKTIKQANKYRRKIPIGNYAPYLLADIVPIYTPTYCYRRSLLEKIDESLIFEQGWMMEDLPMWLEMSRHTSFGYIDQSLATYSVAKNSVCRPGSIEKQLKFEESITQVQRYYHKHYFNNVVTDNDISQASLVRIASIYRSLKLYKESFEIHKSAKLSGRNIVYYLSQKNYLLYRLLILGKQIVNKIR